MRSMSKGRKRIAVVAAVGAACLATAGVYATTLSITANQDAGGAVNVAACDSALVVQTSAPVFNDADGHNVYEVASFTVSDISPTCDGLTLYATAINQSGAAIQSFSHVYDDAVDDGAFTFEFSTGDPLVATPVASSLLDDFALAIHE